MYSLATRNCPCAVLYAPRSCGKRPKSMLGQRVSQQQRERTAGAKAAGARETRPALILVHFVQLRGRQLRRTPVSMGRSIERGRTARSSAERRPPIESCRAREAETSIRDDISLMVNSTLSS